MNNKNNRFRRIFDWIRERCRYVKHPYYNKYWWKWILLIWKWTKEFRRDMYSDYIEHCKKYWEKNTTIDRIDNNWNYCKENCRWVTRKEQQRNRRNNINITYNNKTQCLTEWCEELDLNYHTVRDRIKRYWWSIERAFNT